MGRPLIGDVVVVTFPFSDLSGSKKRPAFVAGHAEHGELILCQITSQPYASKNSVTITPEDFATQGLDRVSFARPDKLFTADESIVARVIGSVRPNRSRQVRDRVAHLFE
jgi:mRNA interferase MazF